MLDMHYDEQAIHNALDKMKVYGGSFVKKLADCYWSADATNKKKLLKTFDEYFIEYARM